MVFERNMKVLKSVAPDIACQIGSPQNRFGFSVDDTGKFRLGKQDRETTFTSADIREIVTQINAAHGFAWLVFGAGFCADTREMEKIEKDRLVIIFEFFPEVIRALMEKTDMRAAFTNPNIRFVTGGQPYIRGLFSDETSKMLSFRGFRTTEVGNSSAFAPEWYTAAAKEAEQFFMKRDASVNVMTNAGERIFENRFRNLFQMMRSRPVDDLAGICKGKPAIIVASGPSLEKNTGELRSGSDAVIIAVDSAVAPLMADQIRADFIITADFRDMTCEKLAPFAEGKGGDRLVFFAESAPGITSRLSFDEKYWMFIESPSAYLFKKLLKTPFTQIPDVQSVVHGAMHLACLMDCDPIILTGLDLAYSSEKDHASGTILHWGNMPEKNTGGIVVPGVDGIPVLTDPGFIAQKEICEQIIARDTGRRWIDATEGGAIIEGTEIIPLKEALGRFCSEGAAGFTGPEKSGQEVESQDIQKCLAELKRLKKEAAGFRNEIVSCLSLFPAVKKEVRAGNWKNLSQIPDSVKNRIGKMDSLNERLNKNESIASLKELTLSGYQDYLELSLAGPEENESLTGRILSSLRQQEYVHKLRLDALERFEKILSGQMSFLNDLKQAGIRLAKNPELPEAIFQNGLVYYNHGQQALSKKILETLPDIPEHRFLLGCIAVRAGEIRTGKELFEGLIESDQSFRPRIIAFIEKYAGLMAAESAAPVVAEKNFERILQLGFSSDRISEVLQKLATEAVIFLIKGNCPEAAGERLLQAWSSDSVPDVQYSALLALLIAGAGEYEFTGRILQSASLNTEWDEKGAGALEHWLSLFEPHGTEWFRMAEPEMLCDWVGKDPVRLIFLQKIFGAFMRYQVWRLYIFERGRNFLDNVAASLEKWAGLKDKMPDWYLFKSLHSRNSGNIRMALEEIEKAIRIESETMVPGRGSGSTCFFKAMFLAESGRGEEARQLIQETGRFGLKINRIITLVLSLIMDGRRAEAESCLAETMNSPLNEKHKGYFEELADMNAGGGLVPFLEELAGAFRSPVKAERFFSAWMFYDVHLKEEFSDSVRNILADIRPDLSPVQFKEINRFLKRVWQDDTEKIRNNSPDAAAAFLNRWRPFKSGLPGWHVVCAEVIISAGDNSSALAYLDNNYNLCRNDVAFLEFYTLQLFICGRTDDALSVFEELLSLSPESVNVLRTAGDNFYNAGNYQAALTIYEECLVLMPEQYDILYRIGDIFFDSGDHKSARMAWEALLKNIPDHRKAAEGLKRLTGPGISADGNL